jgi:putative membrane protein
MKQSLLVLLAFGLIMMGCSSNKAAAPQNSSVQRAPSNASSSTASFSSAADQSFIDDATEGNRAEITLGKMVAARTNNPSVKQFAEMMVKDHTDALNKLQKLAQAKNIKLPDDLPDDAKDLQAKLSNDTGKQFDKDYMDAMVQDHEGDVQEFQDATPRLQDSQIGHWAVLTLPTLQKHLDKARQVDAKVNGGKSNTESNNGQE